MLITSRSNPLIIETASLKEKKYRERSSLFIFEGVKLFDEAVKRGVDIVRVFATEKMTEYCKNSAYNGEIITVSDSVYEKLSSEKAPEGIICVAKYIDKSHNLIIIYKEDEMDARKDSPILLLESVRDPLNVGAIIRSAAALGVGRLIMSAVCADLYHPKTLRAAMGPLFSMPITRVEDLAGTVKALRQSGRRIYAAALDDTAICLGSPELDAEREGHPVGAVIGNEGHGLTEAVIAACDRSVYIPMKADTESLNAGVAAALIMWEICKK